MDKITEIFEWLFEIMLICMGGKHPKTTITDEDLAMRDAIRKTLSNTNHHNCFFHIVKKAKEKDGRIFLMEENKHLHENIFTILTNLLTESELEL